MQTDLGSIEAIFGQFDTIPNAQHLWDNDNDHYPSQHAPIMQDFPELLATDIRLFTLIKKIINILDYILLLRNQWMRLRAEQLLTALLRILNMKLENRDKAQLIRNQWMDWLSWMQAIHPGPDRLREECGKLGREVIDYFLSS